MRHEVHDDEDREHDDADHEVAAHHELAERLDDVAGGGRAFMAVRQDQPGRRQIQRQPQHRRDQQHGREDREFQRRLDEQRCHQDQHRQDDRDRQEQVEQDRRQRQDQDDEDRQHADRKRDVAALEHAENGGQAGQVQAAGRRARGCGSGGGDVAHGWWCAPSAEFAGFMVTGGLTELEWVAGASSGPEAPLKPKCLRKGGPAYGISLSSARYRAIHGPTPMILVPTRSAKGEARSAVNTAADNGPP
jgi:hypothetical protein